MLATPPETTYRVRDVSLLERCPHFRGCYVQASVELGPEDVSLMLERCPHFRGCYVQASMELGPEDVSLLERCPHFRGCYVQASVELGLEDTIVCPYFKEAFSVRYYVGPDAVYQPLEKFRHFRWCSQKALHPEMCSPSVSHPECVSSRNR